MNSLVENRYAQALAAHISIARVQEEGSTEVRPIWGSIYLLPFLDGWSTPDFALRVMEILYLDVDIETIGRQPDWLSEYDTPRQDDLESADDRVRQSDEFIAQTPAGTPELIEDHLNAVLNQPLTIAEQTVHEHIDLALHHNAQYYHPQLLVLQVHCGIADELANGGDNIRQQPVDGTVTWSDTRCPISQALGRHLRQLDFDAITTQFDAVYEELHSLVRTTRLLPGKATEGIDVHDWWFYGDPDTPLVLHTNLDGETNTAFKILTACLVTDDLRLTIAAKPINDDEHLPELLDLVLTQAAEWVDTRWVILDWGFYSVWLLESQDLDYVVRPRRFPSLADSDTTVRVEHEYRVSRSRPPYDEVMLSGFCMPHAEKPNEKRSYFVTNLPVDVALAQAVADSYRRRWEIETSYRVTGEFLPRTTPKSFSVRLFYVLFAVALYDIWVLTNVLLNVVSGEVERDRPIISIQVFAKLLREALRLIEPMDPLRSVGSHKIRREVP